MNKKIEKSNKNRTCMRVTYLYCYYFYFEEQQQQQQQVS
jgi:hypothetical protein